jgi:hypothetical protein
MNDTEIVDFFNAAYGDTEIISIIDEINALRKKLSIKLNYIRNSKFISFIFNSKFISFIFNYNISFIFLTCFSCRAFQILKKARV